MCARARVCAVGNTRVRLCLCVCDCVSASAAWFHYFCVFKTLPVQLLVEVDEHLAPLLMIRCSTLAC